MAGAARQPNTAYRRAFGQRLRELRLERDLSQERLANTTGISRSYVYGIEAGTENPALDHIVRLAVGLGVEPAILMPRIPAVPTKRR